jgi:hypothetical protein
MKYFITYNDNKTVFHYGILVMGQYLTTGLKNTYKTDVKNDFVTKLLTDFKTEYKEVDFSKVEYKTEPHILPFLENENKH